MIHGSKKNKHVKTEQEVKEEDQMSQKINQKLAEFFAIPRQDINPQQLPKYLEFIALLMQLVSDIPTVFNLRRELVEKAIELAKQGAEGEVAKLLGGEVKLTTKLIQSDPKSYTIWSYRQWLVKCLFKVNPSAVRAQKELIKMLLLKDEKNFHVWNYRNWLNSIESFIDEELQFTTDKIKSNPFNFSPYHFRTKFLHQKYSQLLASSDLSPEQSKEIRTFGMPNSQLLSEFETVKTSIFLNPHEEAPWLFYNWLLGQLVPAFVVSHIKKEHCSEITLNMKVGSFSQLIEGEDVVLTGRSGNLQSSSWELKSSSSNLTIGSNLDCEAQVKLESTGRLFLGEQADPKWISEYIKSIFTKELAFLDEVIESEEDAQCRFAFLQKAAIAKLILQCGTTQAEFCSTVKVGLDSVRAIEGEMKASKYTHKQIEFWLRLERDKLTGTEQALKHHTLKPHPQAP